jgi:alcohol dehydrogenase class IV
MVCSKSTKKYIDEFNYDELLIISKAPDEKIMYRKNEYKEGIAIGGGAVIDTAKILCSEPVLAIPTTYSGACSTSHAVYWCKNKKCNVDTPRPIIEIREEWINLPKEVEMATKVDCLCHILESLISSKSTKESDKMSNEAISKIKEDKWLEASILAGRAIEIAGTNILHGLSYGLTSRYKIPHGVALSHILNLAKNYRKVEGLL